MLFLENEQYLLLTSQNTFLTKLKEECCTLAKKLEQISQKTRSEIAQLSQEKRYTYDKLGKLQRRNEELEEQCVQHGRVHEIMKQRLRQLDKHSQATAQQLVQLLNKQNQLLLERQSLSEEVDRLRTQVLCRTRRRWESLGGLSPPKNTRESTGGPFMQLNRPAFPRITSVSSKLGGRS